MLIRFRHSRVHARAKAVHLCAVLLFLGLNLQVKAVAASRPSAAPSSQRERARKLFMQGELHFAEGAYTAALRDYQHAFTLTNLRGFLLNIAHCHARLGNIREATKHYRFYLQRAPAKDAHRQAVEDALAALTGAKARGPRPALPPAPAKPVATAAPSPAQTLAGETPSEDAEPTVETNDEPSASAPKLAVYGEPSGLDLRQKPQTPQAEAAWPRWVWPAVGAAVLAAGATFFLLSRQDQTQIEEGSIGTLSR